MSPFWQVISFLPLLIGGIAFAIVGIRAFLRQQRLIAREEERDHYLSDARAILMGDRRPEAGETEEFIVKLHEAKELMDDVLRAAADPIVDVSLGHLKGQLEGYTKKLEERGL